jgi:hypothetical protein
MNEYENITKGLTEEEKQQIEKVLEIGDKKDMFIVAYSMGWRNKAKQMVDGMKQFMNSKK